MQMLILLRHGEALAGAPSGRDFDRALTQHGRDAARAAGAALARAGLAPDVALVSPAVRTRQTWSAVAEGLGPAAPRGVDAPELYDGSADALLACAQACGGQAVAVVAHNPGVGELAARLSGAPAPFAPAALAVFGWAQPSAPPRLLLRLDPAGAPA